MLGADVPQDIDIQAIMASIKQYYIPHALTEAQRINQRNGVLGLKKYSMNHLWPDLRALI
jgi:hypothetical protein